MPSERDREGRPRSLVRVPVRRPGPEHMRNLGASLGYSIRRRQVNNIVEKDRLRKWSFLRRRQSALALMAGRGVAGKVKG